jgi:hypothetical protein
LAQTLARESQKGPLEDPEKTASTSATLANSGHEKKGPAAAYRDADLARLVNAWPSLPEPIRRAILALVASAGGP